jgi:hypothetical protein
MFAHLQLQASAIEPDAIDNSPSMQALRCNRPMQQHVASMGVILPDTTSQEAGEAPQQSNSETC